MSSNALKTDSPDVFPPPPPCDIEKGFFSLQKKSAERHSLFSGAERETLEGQSESKSPLQKLTSGCCNNSYFTFQNSQCSESISEGEKDMLRENCVHGGEQREMKIKRDTNYTKVNYKDLLSFATRSDKLLMLGGILGSFFAGVCYPLYTIVFGHMVSALIYKRPGFIAETVYMTRSLLALGSLAFVLNFLYLFCWMLATSRQMRCLRVRLLRAILEQELGWHDRHRPGELLSRIDGDTSALQDVVGSKFVTGVTQLGAAVGGFTVGIISCWQLSVALLAAVPLYTAIGLLAKRGVQRISAEVRCKYSVAGTVATEALANSRIVQAFSMESNEVARFAELLQGSRVSGVKRDFATNLCSGLMLFVGYSLYAVTFWYASFLVQWDKTDIARITTAFLASLNASFALGQCVSGFSLLFKASGTSEALFKTINRVPQIKFPNGGGRVLGDGEHLPEGPGRIAFHNVHFSYPSRPEDIVFDRLNLTIELGTTVALTGPSGCGKSSVIQLIERMYDPEEGEITLNGVNLREIDLEWWRNRIGLVPQDPTLFAGTIADNIRVGRQDATLEECEEACRLAGIHSLIEALPQRYNTAIGAVGSHLSGGQRQCLALARALVRRPDILILDEASSALDRESEAEIQMALNRIIHKRKNGTFRRALTVIIITHRLSSVREVDAVHLLGHTSEGKGTTVLESGTFDELVAKGRTFSLMVKAHMDTSAHSPVSALESSEQGGEIQSRVAGGGVGGVVRAERYLGTPQRGPDYSLASAQLTANGFFPSGHHLAIRNTVIHPRLFAPFLRGTYWALFLGLIGSFLVGSIPPLMPIIVASVLTTLSEAGGLSPDVVRGSAELYSGLFLLLASSGLIGWLLHTFYAVSGERAIFRLRRTLFSCLLAQDQSFFDVPGHDPGSLSSVISRDTELVHQCCGCDVGYIAQFCASLLVGSAVAMRADPRIAKLALCFAPFSVLSGFSYMFLGRAGGFAVRDEEEASFDATKAEALSNIRVVAAFGIQERIIEDYEEHVRVCDRDELRSGMFVGFAYGLCQFFFYATFAATFTYGAHLVQRGETDFCRVMIATMAVLSGASSAGRAASCLTNYKQILAATKRVFYYIQRQPVVRGTASPVKCTDPFKAEKGVGVQISRVTLTYPSRPGAPALRKLNLTLAPSSQTALVGQIGCGKSSVIALLERFYEPTAGTIEVNGVDLYEIDLATWRAGLGLVPQEPSLRSGSVASNILYGNIFASEEDVRCAAKLSGIHEDIMTLPQGYETDVGHRGALLSGGQRQRVALARALVRNPRLLLLDEATSALDCVTESCVLRNLEKWRSEKNTTIVAVAHRLTTVQSFSNIALIKRGRVIEEGTHDGLLELDGNYKTMWELSQLGFQ